MDPEPIQSVVGFRPHQSSTHLATQPAYPKGDSGRLQTILGTTLPLGVTPASHTVIKVFNFIVNQFEVLTLPMKGPTVSNTQLQEGGAHNPQEILWGHRAQVIWKIVPLSPRKHLHHKTILTSLGATADMHNTQKQNG